MATVDLTKGLPGVPFGGINKVYRVSNRLDFSKVNALAGDVFRALDIKANTKVYGVYVKIVTPEGSAVTASVGDETDADGWDTSVNLNASAGTFTQTITTDGYGADGKIYTADDTINLTVGADIDTCIIDVYAKCLDLN
ncbi:MAG: hypothetical protein L3V56_13090 [Candidatus Magnetoovum sp. WYHC-5]|nr:hypothetical protein [Candidatus Magnetoovum sp. WYHC-5]